MLSVLMFLTLGFSIGSLAKTQESVGVIASIFIYPQIVMSGVFNIRLVFKDAVIIDK